MLHFDKKIYILLRKSNHGQNTENKTKNMKSIRKLSFYLFIIVFVFVFLGCSKAKRVSGTYDGVTTIGGTVFVVTPNYDEYEFPISSETKNVKFEITKGNDRNKIILKQVAGDENDQFQTTGIVNKNKITLDSFDIFLGYKDLSVKVKVNDMTGTIDDGLFTYDYTYSYYQSYNGASLNIKMKASGSAQKE